MSENTLELTWIQAVNNLANALNREHNKISRDLSAKEAENLRRRAKEYEECADLLDEMVLLSSRGHIVNLVPRDKAAYEYLKSEVKRLTEIVNPSDEDHWDLTLKLNILAETEELLAGFDKSPFEKDIEE